MELRREGAEGAAIRGKFAETGGGRPLREVAIACIHDGVWDATQLESMQVAGAIKRIKAALRADVDGTGLPFACALGKGSDAKWKQIEFFTYEDFDGVLSMGTEALWADHAKLRALQDSCRRKYGTAPSIPDLD